MNVFEKARSLGLSQGEYLVVASGPLAAHGIREANDLDVLVSPEVYERFKSEGWEERVIDAEGAKKLIADDVELLNTMVRDDYRPDDAHLLSHPELINGIPFMPLPELRAFKLVLGRDKDLRDVEMIDAYLAEHPSHRCG